jgi:hypothetical protein
MARCREVGDLTTLAGQLCNRVILDLQVAAATCAQPPAATPRRSRVWEEMSALGPPGPLPFPPLNSDRRDKLLRKARDLLGQAGKRAAAEQRRAARP